MKSHYEGMDITAEEALEECKPLDHAIRQYRHNYDNSESLFHPKEGFVFAYDIEITKKIVDDLEATIQSQSEQITELTVGFENLLRAYKGMRALRGPDFAEKEAETILQKYRAQSDN